MARPRLQIPGGIYHLTARGNERAAIFRDDADRRHFLELVAELRERYHWRIFSYCLMSNHYHLLAQTPEPNLARGKRQLKRRPQQCAIRRGSRGIAPASPIHSRFANVTKRSNWRVSNVW